MGRKAVDQRGLTFSLQQLICQANTTALFFKILLRKTSRSALVQSGIFPRQSLRQDKVAACRKQGETRREGRWDLAIGEGQSHSHLQVIQQFTDNINQVSLIEQLEGE